MGRVRTDFSSARIAAGGGTSIATYFEESFGSEAVAAHVATRSPVVADQRRIVSATECLVEGEDVSRLLGDPVVVVRGQPGRGVAAGEGCDHVVAIVGQLGAQVAPGPGGVGIAMDQQRERAVRITPLKGAEFDPPGLDGDLVRLGHPLAYLTSW